MAERYALVLAGGVGKRAGGDRPKQFVEIAGVPMIIRTLREFHDFDSTIKIVVVVHPALIKEYEELLKENDCHIPQEIVGGGSDRAESVSNGLSHILKRNPGILDSDDAIIAVHDAARPLIDGRLLERAFATLRTGCGRIPVTKSVNSLRRLTSGKGAALDQSDSESVDRNLFVQVQTPQMFILKDLASAYSLSWSGERQKEIEYELFTDDASIAEAAGIKIELYEGSEENIKVTHPMDFLIAEAILASRNNPE